MALAMAADRVSEEVAYRRSMIAGGDDLSRSFLSLVESGRSRISLRALAVVAQKLDLPISHFLRHGEQAVETATRFLLDDAEIGGFCISPQKGALQGHWTMARV